MKDLLERRTIEEMRFHKPKRRPRGELSPDAVDPVSGLPILHPKAMNLPVPPPTPDLIGEPEKWSFRLDTTRPEHTINMYHVPNSEAPALLPMHMSSLSVPSMEKRRFCIASWANMEDQAPIVADRVDAFLQWVKRSSSTHGEHSALYHSQLDSNISLSLGHRLVRGVYAKCHFAPGDVILDIPIDQDPSNVANYGAMLNSERAKLCSRVANHEHVKMPSFQAVYDAICDPRNEFEVEYHPLFVDQVLLALYIGSEKAAGKANPLHPYLSLFPDPLFDDEGIVLEVHLGVTGRKGVLDYNEHVKSFRYTLQEVQRHWPLGGCPPPLKDLVWGLRFVLSRQQMLPNVRQHIDHIKSFAEASNDDPDWITRGVRAVHRFWLHNVLGALDVKRENVNDFDPHTAPER